MQAANGQELADSGEGYKNKGDCRARIDLVKGSATAPVHEKSHTKSPADNHNHRDGPKPPVDPCAARVGFG